jgi:phosphatidylglycerophosphatase C
MAVFCSTYCASSPVRPVPREAQGSGNLAVFDLDGTITRHDSLLAFLVGYLWRHPWRLPRSWLVLPPLLRYAVRRDRGQFKGAVIQATLGGLRRATVERWAAQFVPRLLRHGLYGEALDAIKAHKLQGDRLLLMSASTDLYVPLIARSLGFDECLCSGVRWRPDGRLDGRLSTANCYGEEKRRCLQALIARDGPGHIYAYGNSGSDLAHLRLAQSAFLINAPARIQRGAGPGIHTLRWTRRGSP